MPRHEYDSGDEEFAASVAAAAYAVHSLDASRINSRNENTLTRARSRSRSRNDNDHFMPRSRTTKIESTDTRQESTKKPDKGDGPLTGKPRKISSSSSCFALFNSNNTDAEIDTREKIEIDKIKKRYSKMRSRIQAWEDEKKAKARIKLQKKKIELESKKESNQRHYQLKIEHIGEIERGARAKMDEKMRSEEAEIKERAAKMRSVGRSRKALYFICF
uniref:Remorin C-terminal domain-containing protein n=1 Tax=Kalanchoe fedtschenkoi TaxID=63787 RepID=A0A7N0TYF9_KALFE